LSSRLLDNKILIRCKPPVIRPVDPQAGGIEMILNLRPIHLIGMTIAAGVVSGQTQVDLRTQTKDVDFSTSASTRPVKTGSALPSVCSVGDLFFSTTAPAGANLFGCAATNTWTQSGAVIP